MCQVCRYPYYYITSRFFTKTCNGLFLVSLLRDLKILSFSSQYQEFLSQHSTMLPKTNCICEDFGVIEDDDMPNQDLVLVRESQWQQWENISVRLLKLG